MEEERRQLHRAIEKEHRYLMAEKAKMAIGKRLADTDYQPATNKATTGFVRSSSTMAVKDHQVSILCLLIKYSTAKPAPMQIRGFFSDMNLNGSP